MKELLRYILSELVSSPDKIEIEETVKGNQVDFTVKVAEEDIGSVIGRGGRVANSIRTVVRSMGRKENKHVNIRFE